MDSDAARQGSDGGSPSVAPIPGAIETAAFAAGIEAHRRELLVHCYRMVGSVDEAQDLVQETMLRAWRSAGHFDPSRASVRTWLYRIATNVCLTSLRARNGRPLPSGVAPAFEDPDAAFVAGHEVAWLQPFPDRLLADDDPAQTAVERSNVRLAVIAALQLLPPKQRAALILRDVLRFSAGEAAEMLDTSVPSLNSALQRARKQLQARTASDAAASPPSPIIATIADRYVDAFERGDVAGLVRLLAEDVILEMPPMWNWYRGRERYATFMQRVFRTRGTDWRTVPLSANGEPAFAAYALRGDSYELHTLQVLSIAGERIRRTTVFQDSAVFALFELDPSLPR